ncbi:MAG TPA: HAMP domain-containing histidine kinase [Campylobacterales bacterium]|nr:HAMP domain-containing histidine kinase [Campylobacterales bacterium]HIP41070.1 HAMP domain-containing histidine kinase [Campylobacterales bacterium]
MLYRRPSLTEYVIARLVTIIIIVTTLYTLIIVTVPKEIQNTAFHVALFVLALLLILSSVYVVARQVKKELKIVEKYLSGVEEFDEGSRKARFFTREFETINLRLIQILRKIKNENKKKRKYTAKIKLKNRQRSDMLSAIAHEFRNPIAATMGYAQTLNDDDDIPPALRKKFLTKIYNNGEKIEELLSRLLLWNRFESGEQRLHLSKFDMYPLIREVASNLEERYKERQIRVEEHHLVVKADKALMEIVMKNLIENALKYSKEPIEIGITQNQISVTDKGVGISSKNIDKVTKKFFRTDEHSWDNSMGLGLAIVKQILKLHHTLLLIESEEDKGSTFYFNI